MKSLMWSLCQWTRSSETFESICTHTCTHARTHAFTHTHTHTQDYTHLSTSSDMWLPLGGTGRSTSSKLATNKIVGQIIIISNSLVLTLRMWQNSVFRGSSHPSAHGEHPLWVMGLVSTYISALLLSLHFFSRMFIARTSQVWLSVPHNPWWLLAMMER